MISGDAPNGATGSYDGGTAGGSANALTATVSGLGSSPSTGNVVILKTSAANTGAATLAINSGSAIAIKNQDGTTALAGGEMASAKYYLLEYNGTNWVLLNPVVSGADITASLSNYGLILAGNQSLYAGSATQIFRGSSGEITLNCGSFGWFQIYQNGANYHIFGTTGWQLVSGTSGAGASIANIYRNSSGGITYNAPTGGTHIATVNGVRAGGFPLLPGDMPWCGLSLSKSANQSISAGNSSTHCTWDVELVAEASPFTHSTSSTTEEVIVNLTGKVRVSGVIQFDVTSSGGLWRKVYAQIKKNGTVIAEPESGAYDTSSAYTSLPIVIDIVLALSSGDVIKILPTSYHAFDILGQSSSKNKSTLTFEYLGA